MIFSYKKEKNSIYCQSNFYDNKPIKHQHLKNCSCDLGSRSSFAYTCLSSYMSLLFTGLLVMEISMFFFLPQYHNKLDTQCEVSLQHFVFSSTILCFTLFILATLDLSDILVTYLFVDLLLFFLAFCSFRYSFPFSAWKHKSLSCPGLTFSIIVSSVPSGVETGFKLTIYFKFEVSSAIKIHSILTWQPCFNE